MAKVTQYTCDFPGCTAVRTESNHWFIIAPITEDINSMSILPFSEEIEKSLTPKNALCICSEAHVIQYISSALSKLFPLRVEEYTYNQNDVPLKYPEVPQNRP